MLWRSLSYGALFCLTAERTAFAQRFPICIPGTPVCARAGVDGGSQGTSQAQGAGGVQIGAGVQVQGSANPSGVRANGAANTAGGARADASAHAGAQAQGGPNFGAWGNLDHGVTSYPPAGADSAYSAPRQRYSAPVRFGAGVTFCGTVKAGVFSGIKFGPCFAVSFRTEVLTFELESQLLFGGVRDSIDWVFPMSFVVPLTQQRSLYQGLQLRFGGSPIGVTFAKPKHGGNYLRFGLHAGLSYEYELGAAASWRVFDARAFLDFGTKREVDERGNFLDSGGQLSTGLVF
ncbi:MAG TPA: hypothetical protein VFQ61_33645 [Polyangiaceae bacterium]|nr:hypothetical protein [Polyangiaceae bacterium]